MPRALVTGAAGFIGGALSRRLLREGWEIHALLGCQCRVEALADIRDRITLHPHDGSMSGMQALMEAAQPDVVFHLASLFLVDHTSEQVEPLVTSNLHFPLQLAEAMVRQGCLRLVNTGTSWQQDASGQRRPVNLYAATKQAFEDMLNYHHDAHDLSCITLKLFDTYGPGDPRRKLITILLEAAREEEALDMSPGEQLLELTHVDDVTAAFRMAADRLLSSSPPLLESYFVSGDRMSLRDLVAEVRTATGSSLPVRFGGRPYRPREVMVPVSPEGCTLPGWRPAITLRQGLAEVFGSGTSQP